ncbi:MAG: TetR/AcrR family transcriptional regulator [Pseudomonadota bacterium]
MKDANKDAGGTHKGRPYRGEASESRVMRRRAALIEAGLELFGTKGYRTTSVKEICSAVGLTERYFYESFSNREALLAAVYQTIIAEMSVSLESALRRRRGDSEARVRALLRAFFRYVHNDERRARVMLVEVLGISPEIDRLYHTAVRNLAELMEHPALGLFPARTDREKHVTSMGLVGAMAQIATHWMLDGFRTPFRQVERGTSRLFLAMAAAARDTD